MTTPTNNGCDAGTNFCFENLHQFDGETVTSQEGQHMDGQIELLRCRVKGTLRMSDRPHIRFEHGGSISLRSEQIFNALEMQLERA